METTDYVNPENQTGSVTNERLLWTLEHQERAMKKFESKFEEKMKGVDDLASAVHLLTDRLNRVDGYDRRVTLASTQLAIHKTLLGLAGTIIVIFIPIMIGWNSILKSELQLLRSSTDITTEKVRSLELQVEKLSVVKGNAP